MKTLLRLSAAALILFSTVSFAQNGTIATTAHDLSATFGGGEICVVCHAPHNNLNTSDLLWNHTDSEAVYVPYSSTTFDGTGTNPGTPAGSSKLCLSCHDGTIAVDAFGGAAGTTVMGAVNTGSGDMGFDLQNDHPISFDWNDTDTELNDISNTVTLGNGNIVAISSLLEGGTTMQCATCHDVHNTRSGTNTYLLNVDNTGSAFCLDCHAK